MHTRPYHPEDLPRLADITCHANLSEALTRFIRPHIATYPLSYWQTCHRAVSSATAASGVICFVAETDEGEVVGYAIWERKGEGPVARKWRRRRSGRGMLLVVEKQVVGRMADEGVIGLEATLLAVRDAWSDFFHLDWSADYGRRTPVVAALGKEWDPEVFAECWELGGLMVAVERQRQGIGAMLLRWGLEQAEAEGVPCCVQSSEVGVGFYEKAGFKAFEVLLFEGTDIRMPRMIWEPKGMEGRWLDRLGGKVEEKVVPVS